MNYRDRKRIPQDSTPCICKGCGDDCTLGDKELDYMIIEYGGIYCDECRIELDRKDFYQARDEYGY